MIENGPGIFSCFRKHRLLTMAPNSTRFASFCRHFATNVKVLAAVGEGDSGKQKLIQIQFN